MADSESPLPITFTMAALPVGFRGTPQELADAMVERLQLVSQQTYALFTVGATEPSSDVGPWLRNGQSWYYFNPDVGEYVPVIIPQESLGYQVSVSAPTDDAINVWIATDTDGIPIAINLRTVQGGSTVWESVYYLKTEVYTKAETDLQITKQIRYGVRAKPNATQNFAIDAANHKLTFDGIVYDAQGRYDDSNQRYTALVKGVYQVNALVYLDNVSGTVAGMQAGVRVMKNGAVAGTDMGGNVNNTPSPNGSFWTVPINAAMLLDAGDYIELAGVAEDGVNTGDLQLNPTESHWEIYLVETQD